MFVVALFILAVSAYAVGASDTFFIAPRVDATGEDVAIIFIHGAQISNTAYVNFFNVMQNATNLRLWVGLPGFTDDLPNPVQIPKSVDNAIKMMVSAGMKISTPTFFSGHSLGSVVVQDYLVGGGFDKAVGLVLTGGFIQRKYVWPTFKYTLPTLTLGGELDGLARVTRIVEGYYNQVLKNLNDFPVVVLRGQNHWQFAGSGSIPLLVKERDLMAEVSQQAAWEVTASLYLDFISTRLKKSDAGAVLKSYLEDTAKFSAPIIAAYEYEGGRFFNSPNQIGGPLESSCVKGGCPDQSKTTPAAQELIGANIDSYKVKATNIFVDLGASPVKGEEFHLPNVTAEANKNILVTTYVQAFWDKLDSEDTGFSYTSANELGSKMASRQCIMINGAGYTKETAPFSVDDPQFCSEANENAYKWAIATAEATTSKRFNTYGEPYVFADDLPRQGGPLWLDASLQYNKVKLADGSSAISIAAPMQKTEIDYWETHFPFPRPDSIPDPGCYHYCKLLSPARAMEWIYVDSLRLNRSIN